MLKEFVLKTLPVKEYHASTLLELADGSIFLAWFGGSKEGNNDVAIWGALRTENGWSPPMFLAKINKLPHWNPVLFKDPDNNDIYLYFKVGRNCSHWKTIVMKSSDNAKTWTAPEELVKGNIGGRGPVKNKPIVLSDRSWLAPASSEIGWWQAFTDRSEDHGKTWERSKLIRIPKTILGKNSKGDEVKFGVIQPTLWESEPGRVHMLLRSSAGRIYRSDSNDYGRSWCKVYPTELPNNNSGIDLAKLTDGTLLLAYNPVSKNWGPRWPMSLAISTDNGTEWKKCLDTDIEKKEYSYPAVIATSDGGAAISYTWGRRNIVFIKLSAEDINNLRKDTSNE